MFSTLRSEATLVFWYRLSPGQHQSTSNQRTGINIISFSLNATGVSRRSTNSQTRASRLLVSSHTFLARTPPSDEATLVSKGGTQVFIQFFGSGVPPTSSIQKIGFPSQASRNGGPREDPGIRNAGPPFRKRFSKMPRHHRSPP